MKTVEQIASELVTIRDCIRWGVSQFNQHGLFYGHGMTSALDEAVYLTLFALHLPHDFSVEYFDTRHITQRVNNQRKILLKV